MFQSVYPLSLIHIQMCIRDSSWVGQISSWRTKINVQVTENSGKIRVYPKICCRCVTNHKRLSTIEDISLTSGCHLASGNFIQTVSCLLIFLCYQTYLLSPWVFLFLSYQRNNSPRQQPNGRCSQFVANKKKNLWKTL